MARPATGTVLTVTLKDGSRKFRVRFRAHGRREELVLHERAGCACGCGGGWTEPAARTELGNILARIRVGVWQRPDPTHGATRTAERMPTFHDYASTWLQGKLDGALGDRPIATNTEADYRWILTQHLLPYFARYRLDQIDRQLCLAFKTHKLHEAAELRAALAAGADIRDHRGRRAKPLSPSSIRKLIDRLAAILDEAVEDELIDRNPARGKRMRVHVPKPKRGFLELDELAALIDAAASQDAIPQPNGLRAGDSTRAQVARLIATGHTPTNIAAALGLSKPTVSYHLTQLGISNHSGYVGRRAIVEILGRSGVRASELCDLRLRDIRLHDPNGARFQIRDAKTEAGVREVQMTPDLVEALIDHIDRLRRAGLPTGPNDHAVPNRRGGRMTRQRVGQIVTEAAALATERNSIRGLPPLPRTTPHALRRTYISIALVANNFDVKWVMSQVGHADSKMTLDVYAQLEQRIARNHGIDFDRLVRQSRADRTIPAEIEHPNAACDSSGRAASLERVPRPRAPSGRQAAH
jgi:integrase